MHERWKRAVVHLEAATDSQPVYDRIRRLQELQERGLDEPEFCGKPQGSLWKEVAISASTERPCF